jgi:hypothetical protein
MRGVLQGHSHARWICRGGVGPLQREKRHFEFQATSRGYVRIGATPLLLRPGVILATEFRYTDGTPIPFVAPPPDLVALRSIWGTDLRELDVVGTEADAEAVRSKIYDKNTSHGLIYNDKAANAMFEER